MIFVTVAPKGLSLGASVIESVAGRRLANVAFRVAGEIGTDFGFRVDCERRGGESPVHPTPGVSRDL